MFDKQMSRQTNATSRQETEGQHSLQSIRIPEDILAKWQDIVNTMAELVNVPTGLIMRVVGEDIEVFISSETNGNPYVPGHSEHLFGSGLYCENVLTNEARLLVADALTDPQWKDNPDTKVNMISYLGFPILWPNKTPFGTICVLDCKANSYSDTYEKLIRHIRDLIEHHLVSIFSDAHYRSRASEDRRRSAEALRASEERFAKAFRLAPAPMALATFEGFRLLNVNDAFSSAVGYPATQLIGRGMGALNIVASATAFREFERTLKSAGGVHDFELQLRCKDGALIDCVVSAETAAIQGERCILTVIQDVTERKRFEGDLMSAIDAVMSDTSWFSRTVIEKLAQLRQPEKANRRKAELADLTARELEVLGHMGQGHSDDEISRQLSLSRNTIRNHVAAIYGKIGVHTRSAAIVWARERGVIGAEAVKERSRKASRGTRRNV
jgi:PAS domain S-box-containing protein